MKFAHFLLISLIAYLSLNEAAAKELSNLGIPEVEIQSSYQDVGTIVVTINDGKLSYRWISGFMEGLVIKDLDYSSKKITESIYVVSWHDIDNRNFMNVILNLEMMIEHNTSIMSYGSPYSRTIYQDGVIDEIKWL